MLCSPLQTATSDVDDVQPLAEPSFAAYNTHLCTEIARCVIYTVSAACTVLRHRYNSQYFARPEPTMIHTAGAPAAALSSPA